MSNLCFSGQDKRQRLLIIRLANKGCGYLSGNAWKRGSIAKTHLLFTVFFSILVVFFPSRLLISSFSFPFSSLPIFSSIMFPILWESFWPWSLVSKHYRKNVLCKYRTAVLLAELRSNEVVAW